ncbi:dCMP cyt deam 1 and/or APOBEC N domain containing protein [Asbolus verrucosus]|uniref:Probable deoxycytidylate deaminase n=1 Tax=Asbolus verrucosus TaxID=1661398 RepID=A0A482W6N2_ASBVE|nr:dCMP cyt deam 1 and/or APOBEC N domain containing protein [Asbolus verrucosus]
MDLCSLLREISIDDNHEHFMAVCCLAAQRSKDPCTQVGACIADRKGNLISSGYNGMPRGCHDDEFPWGKGNSDPLKNKHLYVCHAELNAIANAMGPLEDCIIYVTLFPCNECAKLIIQHGITEVVYMSDKHASKSGTVAAKLMFDSAGIKYWQFKSKKKITIHLVADGSKEAPKSEDDDV